MQFGILSCDMNFEEWNPEVLSNYAGVEIGMLKINPERVPMVVSKEQGYAEMDRWGKKNLSKVEIFDGNYLLIAHEDAIEYGDGLMLLTGNGFILKRQGKTSTGLAVDELLDVADYMEEVEARSQEMAKEEHDFDACYVFEADDDDYCHN